MSNQLADSDLVSGVPRRRIVLASMVGTTIEFYDFYIYATWPGRSAPSSSGTSEIGWGARPRSSGRCC
jgi:hypothetical protein